MKVKTCAVYAIVNLQNEKAYIGGSTNLKNRWRAHKRTLRNNSHYNVDLQNDWNIFGQEQFDFLVVEECSPERLFDLEQQYLNMCTFKYNISRDSRAPMSNRRHTSETKQKFKHRKIKTGKDHYRFGKKWTDEERHKFLSSREGYKHSEITKQRQRNAAVKRNAGNTLLPFVEEQKRPVIDSNGNKFDSLVQAANYWKISVQAICDNLKGRSKKTRIGLTFRYLEAA